MTTRRVDFFKAAGAATISDLCTSVTMTTVLSVTNCSASSPSIINPLKSGCSTRTSTNLRTAVEFGLNAICTGLCKALAMAATPTEAPILS